MMWLLKIVGAVCALGILLVAGFVYDAGWNDGRIVATLLGRDRLVAQCLPAVRTTLADRGFAPTDIEVGAPVSIGLASGSFGSARVLSGPFTFSDGPNGQRVDGRLVCQVHGADIHVTVDVDGLPVRAAWLSVLKA